MMKVKNTYIGRADKTTSIYFTIYETNCGKWFEQGLDADVMEITKKEAERFINNASPDGTIYML